MCSRHFVIPLAVLSLVALTAGTCVPIVKPKVVLPADDSVVQEFEFTIQVNIGAALVFDPATDVVLNFVPIQMTPGPPPTYTATIQAGYPLQDENTILVRAVLNGETIIAGSEFQWLPPKARAFQISDSADLIGGPLAHGRVGDYMLDNGFARFIIQDVGTVADPERDLYSVGAFGGNLIDLESGYTPDRDNFIEIAPMLNIETVVNPLPPVTIVNDGQDGMAAVIRTCGPDDLLDFVNPSSQVEAAGLTFPANANDNDQPIEACTEFSLEPGKSYMKMETTVENLGATNLDLFVGDWINGGGETDFWVAPGQGPGAALFSQLSTLSFIGFDEAAGVDYSYTSIPTQAGGPPDETSNFFTTSGVTVVLNNMDLLIALLVPGSVPPFPVAAGGSRSYTRYIGAGDGSGSNGIDVENEVLGNTVGTLSGCVSFGGDPAPGARVSVGADFLDVGLQSVSNVFTTGPAGCFTGTLPVGSYDVAAARKATPYEGGGVTPTIKNATINAGAVTVVNFALPATGTLRVGVVDESSSPMPGRVTLVGFDPSPEPTIPGVSLLGFGGSDTGLFEDPGDRLPFGIAATALADAAGVAEFEVEPGSYQVYVSRGTEYSLFSTPVVVSAGSNPMVSAQIARVIDTTGFVSSDFHVHGIHSADSRVSHRKRVFQFAGEGIENVVMTDHHVHTDLNPTISALSMDAFLTSTVGEEVTTFDYGHFNAYPLGIDPSVPSGGSTDWARPAVPGTDFPSAGAFNASPAFINGLASGPFFNPLASLSTVVQINHISSHFVPLKIDTYLEPPVSGLTAFETLALRINPAVSNLYSSAFEALELWNGDSRGAQSNFLDERIGIWMNGLNQGILQTAISDTDTHTFTDLNSAGARSWTASPSDAIAGIVDTDVSASVANGCVVGGQGIYVQTRLLADDGSGDVADLSWTGTTLVETSNDEVDLEITVQAPSWAEFDTIEIYANADTVPAASSPYLYTATPTRTLIAGIDFTVNTSNVFPGVTGGTRLEATVTEDFTLSEDTWFVVVVKGSDSVSKPMFPVYPDNLDALSNTSLGDLIDGNHGEAGVMALGVTNALYADRDGGGFDAPGVQPPPGP